MRPEERDLAFLWDMREACREVCDFLAGRSLEEVQNTMLLRRAVERSLEIVGEAARHVSEEFMSRHAEIPWKSIIGLRNLLAHEYGETRVDRLYFTATEKVPELLRHLENCLSSKDD
jgi:uncharacterized protein with HEPN domain